MAAERCAADVVGDGALGGGLLTPRGPLANPRPLGLSGGCCCCGGGRCDCGEAAAKRTGVALVPANVAGTLCVHGAWACSEAIIAETTLPPPALTRGAPGGGVR